MLKFLRRPGFVADAFSVASGTVIGQIVSVLLSPVLTRLYTPDAFGTFGIYTGITAPIVGVICLKFDNTIVLARDTAGARATAALAAIASTIVVIGFYLVLLAARGPIVSQVGEPAYVALMVFSAPTLILASMQGIGSNWSVREGQFKALGRYQTVRSISTATCQVLLSLATTSPIGLLGGQTIGMLLGYLAMSRFRKEPIFVGVDLPSVEEVKAKAVEQRDMAFFSTPQTLISSMSVNMPLVLLAVLFGKPETGLFWLAFRILSLPSQILAESIRGVFYRRAVHVYQARGDLAGELIKMYRYLGLVGLPIALTLAFLGPTLFGLIFGAKWVGAGVYAQWIALPWLITIIAVPSGVIAPILNIQRYYLACEVFGIAIRVGALFLGARLGSDVLAVALYSVASATAILIWLVFSFNYARHRRPPDEPGAGSAEVTPA